MTAISQNAIGRASLLDASLGLPERFVQLRLVLGITLYAVAFYFAYRYGMSFSRNCASPFWFPDTVLLCALLLSPRHRWWLLVLAPLPIRLWSPVAAGIPTWFLLATYANDSVKGLLAALLLLRFIKNPLCLETVHDSAMYCLFAVLLVPAASAFAGAAARQSLGDDYWQAFEQWFTGNALTNLILTPAILYWLFGYSWRIRAIEPKRCIEAVLLAAGLILAGYAAFEPESVKIGLTEARFYAPVPFLFWAAIRFGLLGASGGIVIIAILAVEAALRGRGVFAGRSPADTALALQHFLLLRAAPLYLVGILIEEKKTDERALRESEERFRHMADTAPVLIWMSNSDKNGVFFNQAWLDFTGRTFEQEASTGWADGLHPEDARRSLQLYESSFDARQSFEMEYRLRRHDGTHRWMLDRGVPRYAPDGHFLGYIGSCIDITDRKDADAQVQRQRVELAHAARVSTMGQLASALAHELIQPLGAILRNAEAGEAILQQDQPDLREISSIVVDIRRDDQRAGAVINRMRSLLQRHILEFEPISLEQLLDQVTTLIAPEMLARRVKLQPQLPPALPPVRGDRVHLQQVLLNILVNGADAMKDCDVENRRIHVQARRVDDQTVEVAVRDFGHGVPQEKLDHIFDAFFTTKSNGMGMGLAISKTIVDAHGGRIWAENNPDGGATFRFTLKTAS
jgi:PAS domain S-box-containing protein